MAPWAWLACATAAAAASTSRHHLEGDHEKRIIIATPQRSGSHFVRDLFATRLACGGEEFKEWSTQHSHDQTRESFETELTRVFHKREIFLLHPGQFPREKESGIPTTPDWFLDSLTSFGVKVLFGRRSSVMQLSDKRLAKAAETEFGEHVAHLSTNDPGRLAAHAAQYANLTARHRLPPTEATAKEIRECEDEVAAARRFLAPLKERILFYDYEDLVGGDRELHVTRIVQFVLDADPNETAQFARAALAGVPSPCEAVYLHPPTCAARVDGWPALRARLAGTYAAEGCDRVDAFMASCKARRS